MSTFDVVLLVAAVVFLVVGALEATRFAVRYSATTWHDNREGRHLMRFTIALALTLWGTFLTAAGFAPATFGLLIQAGLFGWLAYELHHRNRLLTLNQAEQEAPCPVCGSPFDEACGVDEQGRKFAHLPEPEPAVSV